MFKEILLGEYNLSRHIHIGRYFCIIFCVIILVCDLQIIITSCIESTNFKFKLYTLYKISSFY